MNNNVLDLVSNVSKMYNLTSEQAQWLTSRFASDTRDINVIENDLRTYASYYQYQNKLSQVISQTMPLDNGDNCYVMAFDSNSNVVLQGVKMEYLNQDSGLVLINQSFKGTRKHSSVDDLEVSVFQIGRLLGFDISEEYMIFNANKMRDSVVIGDQVNNNEFYSVDNLKKRFQKMISSGKVRKEKWVDDYQNISVAQADEDYVGAINYGINILKVLPSMLEEDYKEIESKYFDMILFDSLINQSERNFENYGIICNKETKRYSFASLYDNVFPSFLKNNDVFYFNGITCNRYELMECLFYKYYDKISERVNYILQNKEKILKNIDIIAKYNLNFNTYIMLINNITTNINYFERLNKERALSLKSQNAGFVDVVTVGVVLLIIVAFSLVIAYLLYCIK